MVAGLGATAVQIAEYVHGRRRIVAHVGSAHTEAELGLLVERARVLLQDAGQDAFDLGVEATPVKAELVPSTPDAGLFAEHEPQVAPSRVAAPRALDTPSRPLFEVLAELYAALGTHHGHGEPTNRMRFGGLTSAIFTFARAVGYG